MSAQIGGSPLASRRVFPVSDCSTAMMCSLLSRIQSWNFSSQRLRPFGPILSHSGLKQSQLTSLGCHRVSGFVRYCADEGSVGGISNVDRRSPGRRCRLTHCWNPRFSSAMESCAIHRIAAMAGPFDGPGPRPNAQSIPVGSAITSASACEIRAGEPTGEAERAGERPYRSLHACRGHGRWSGAAVVVGATCPTRLER